jgi:hypothetical protein
MAAFGFDAPISGPDGQIDIYVYEFRASTAYGITEPLTPEADQSESRVLLRASRAADVAITAHEIFHVLQDSVWVPGGVFLDEATAEWAQQRAFPEAGYTQTFEPSVPLDCVDDSLCPEAGYQSWSFFEFLAERYGAGIVREVYEQARTLRVVRDGGPPGLAAISAALVARGSSLGVAFRGFALANILGDFTLESLRDSGAALFTETRTLRTGTKDGRLPRRRFSVDHLATTYVPVRGGTAGRPGRCRKATLRLDITGPASDAFAGASVGEAKPRSIAVTGGRGRLTLRSWSTCGRAELMLALINGSPNADDKAFTVKATLRPR